MIAKFVAVICLFGLTRASGWHGSGLGYASGLGYSSGIGYGSGYGYGGYASYVAPAYTAPVVAKTIVAAPVIKAVVPAVVPAVSYAPAISTVSRYQVHSSPIVKSYVAPVSYASYAPYTVSYSQGYGAHDYSGLGYASHGYSSGYGYESGYGYGSGYGHGAKYLW